jgi:hypothetical protein
LNEAYAKIIQDNLGRLYDSLPPDLAERLSADQDGEAFVFQAFGDICRIEPAGIFLGEKKQSGPVGIVVSLYALNARPGPMIVEPLKAFKDFPGAMPYVGAFATHTEGILTPHVETIRQQVRRIRKAMDGEDAPAGTGGDVSFLVRPLPKIGLCFIGYLADEDFPASAVCLFSSNAADFMPLDGLADVGEYAARAIRRLIGADAPTG